MNNYIYLEYVPVKILNEHSRRWRKLNKTNFEGFFECVLKDANRQWWLGAEDIMGCYKSYINGDVGIRYPAGLRIYPEELLKEVVFMANKMIKFNILDYFKDNG